MKRVADALGETERDRLVHGSEAEQSHLCRRAASAPDESPMSAVPHQGADRKRHAQIVQRALAIARIRRKITASQIHDGSGRPRHRRLGVPCRNTIGRRMRYIRALRLPLVW